MCTYSNNINSSYFCDRHILYPDIKNLFKDFDNKYMVSDLISILKKILIQNHNLVFLNYGPEWKFFFNNKEKLSFKTII